VHETARKYGFDDIAKQCVLAVEGVLPDSWTVDMSFLKKVNRTDALLLSRVQQMINATYRGWGCHNPPVTRDRKNPLATSLKVQQVIHVENVENYLNYMARRDQVVSRFRRLPLAEQKTDWHVKTTKVSMCGTPHHASEPVNNAVNEYWMWHGTSKEGVKAITDTDFDIGLAGSGSGCLYGRGLYFAESCMKADEYAKTDHRGYSPLLLCRVILGRIYYCDLEDPWTEKRRLENLCKTGGEYHCVLGDREKVRGTFREFVIYDNAQVYPEYIVWYSRVPPFLRT